MPDWQTSQIDSWDGGMRQSGGAGQVKLLTGNEYMGIAPRLPPQNVFS